MQRLTMVPTAQGETPEPGWPDESWREYAEHSLTHDDLPSPPAPNVAYADDIDKIHDALCWLDGEVTRRAKYIREHTDSGSPQ